jgi:hypothetical protein
MGKTLSTGKISTIEELRARVQERYEAVGFEHPNYPDVEFQVAILNNGEKEHINTVSRMGTEQQSGWIFNRMSVAYGLVVPELADPVPANATRAAREARAVRIADTLKEYPDDLILPLAEEIWRLTNDYRAAREGGNAPSPFTKTSSSPTSSSTDSTSTPTSSKGGGSSA